ncbi:MAG: efflux RND transporter periplasmic adaptor subunit, partial [Thermoguttaceae bacterium]
MTSVSRRLKAAVPVVVLVAAVGAGIAHRTSLVSWWTGITTPVAANTSPDSAPELAKEKDALTLPEGVAKRLKVQTEPAQPSTEPSTLKLSGSLILDSVRLAHVHARFPGEVVELGNAGNGSRPVAFGQHVRKGQLLAVIWSRDLGEKKSDLIDALSQLRVDEDSLARISKAAAEGAVPERILRDTERKVEADRIAVSRAVRILQSWRISKEEIDQVRAEATRLS